MVAPKAVPQDRTFAGDANLARMDQSREDLAQVLRLFPFLRGRLVSVTFEATTRKVVRHGLGVAAACFVVRWNYLAGSAGPRFAESTQTGVDLTQSLALISDLACTMDLWFYPRSSKTIDAGQGQSL